MACKEGACSGETIAIQIMMLWPHATTPVFYECVDLSAPLSSLAGALASDAGVDVASMQFMSSKALPPGVNLEDESAQSLGLSDMDVVYCKVEPEVSTELHYAALAAPIQTCQHHQQAALITIASDARRPATVLTSLAAGAAMLHYAFDCMLAAAHSVVT